MGMDLFIGVLSALVQFATAWLGWQVTVKPLHPGETRRKTVYKVIFAVAGMLGVVAAGATTIRGAHAAERLNRALGLNRANLDNNGPDKIHFLPVVPVAGQPLVIKAVKRNTGLLDALHVRSVTVVQLFDGRTDIDAFCGALEQGLHDVAKSQHAKEASVPASAEYTMTGQSPTLSVDDVKQIQSGVLGIYVAGAYSYSDEDHAGQPRYPWRYRLVVNGRFPPCKGGADNWNLDWSDLP
jgi:hypothetical protein